MATSVDVFRLNQWVDLAEQRLAILKEKLRKQIQEEERMSDIPRSHMQVVLQDCLTPLRLIAKNLGD